MEKELQMSKLKLKNKTKTKENKARELSFKSYLINELENKRFVERINQEIIVSKALQDNLVRKDMEYKELKEAANDLGLTVSQIEKAFKRIEYYERLKERAKKNATEIINKEMEKADESAK